MTNQHDLSSINIQARDLEYALEQLRYCPPVPDRIYVIEAQQVVGMLPTSDDGQYLESPMRFEFSFSFLKNDWILRNIINVPSET